MTTIFHVEGMSCSHCEDSVKKAVAAVAGVSGVEVDLAAKSVTVSHNGIAVEVISNAIEEQGYDVVRVL